MSHIHNLETTAKAGYRFISPYNLVCNRTKTSRQWYILAQIHLYLVFSRTDELFDGRQEFCRIGRRESVRNGVTIGRSNFRR